MSDATDIRERDLKPALLNGFRRKCPNCGRGQLMHSYLKVHATCSECGQDLRHQRADDGPAYLTILIVGHIVGFVLHIAFVAIRPDPLTLALVVSALALVASLWLLPRIKGMIVAFQWARRMHGF